MCRYAEPCVIQAMKLAFAVGHLLFNTSKETTIHLPLYIKLLYCVLFIMVSLTKDRNIPPITIKLITIHCTEQDGGCAFYHNTLQA